MRRLLMVGLALSLCLRTTVFTVTAPEPLSWQASLGPYTGNVNALVEGEAGTLFAWVDSDVFRSRDDGVTWTRCEGQPQHPNEPQNTFGRWLKSAGRRLYSSGAFLRPLQISDDECASWQAGINPPVPAERRGDLTVIDGGLLAAYDGTAVFMSRDGNAWTHGMKEGALPAGIEPRLTTRYDGVYLVLSQRLYRSNDGGATWSPLAPNGPPFHDVVPGGRALFASAAGGLFRSNDRGSTWVSVHESGFTAVSVRDSTIYLSAFPPATLDRSTDDGRTWTKLPSPWPGHTMRVLLQTQRGTLLAGASGIFRSTDAGATWTATGVRGRPLTNLTAARGHAYASLVDGSLWESTDAGLSWSRIDPTVAPSERPLPRPGILRQLLALDDGTHLIGGTDRELVASDNGGRTWSASGLNKGITGLVRLRNTWFASTWQGVFRSDDLVRWQECSSGFQRASIRGLTATAEGDLIALEDFSVYRSTDACGSWWPLAARLPPLANMNIAKTPPLLTSDASIGLVMFGKGIAQLSAHDRDWTVRAEGPTITAFVRDDQGRYWLGTHEGVARLSVEDGKWQVIPIGLEGSIAALAIDPSGYLIAAVDGRGIFRARLP